MIDRTQLLHSKLTTLADTDLHHATYPAIEARARELASSGSPAARALDRARALHLADQHVAAADVLRGAANTLEPSLAHAQTGLRVALRGLIGLR